MQREANTGGQATALEISQPPESAPGALRKANNRCRVVEIERVSVLKYILVRSLANATPTQTVYSLETKW
jgi:hypothetical protein